MNKIWKLWKGCGREMGKQLIILEWPYSNPSVYHLIATPLKVHTHFYGHAKARPTLMIFIMHNK